MEKIIPIFLGQCYILSLSFGWVSGVYIPRHELPLDRTKTGVAPDAAPLVQGREQDTRRQDALTLAVASAGSNGQSDLVSASTRTQGLRFLRIQKTGGSIFGGAIMKKFCGSMADGCRGSSHEDWSQVNENGKYHGAVVTLLRDPVERTLSEFFWLRSPEGLASVQDADWDFSNKTWLDIVQTHHDVDYALDAYLHGYEKSPSRNRQTLYLLGFRDGINGDQGSEMTFGGAAYDWDSAPGKYVRWAMENLESMTVYGITDCWMPSMRAIARQLGWEMPVVEEFAAASTPEYGKHELTLDGAGTETGTSWRRAVARARVREIEQVNKVDMVVFRRALKRFAERFGEACSLPYEPFGPVMREKRRRSPEEE